MNLFWSFGLSFSSFCLHCKSPCKARFSAKVINEDFEDGLNNFVPYPGMAELFKEVIMDAVSYLDLYSEGDIPDQRYVIGSIYGEKWTIENNKGRTGKVNIAIQLIYKINASLGRKKARVRTQIRVNSGLELPAVLRSKHFKQEILRIAKIPIRKNWKINIQHLLASCHLYPFNDQHLGKNFMSFS